MYVFHFNGMNKLNEDRYMFVSPSLKENGIFTQCSENILNVLDRNGLILETFSVKFDIKQQWTAEQYGNGGISVSWCNIYSPLIVGGKTYLQLFENVVEIVDNQVIKVCEIPDFPKDDWCNLYGKLFQKGDQLFASNGEKIYKIVEGHLAFVKYSELQNFYQFCDNVIGWYNNSKTQISVVNDDLSENEIFRTEEDIKYFSFAQGGVAIFTDDPFTKAFVFNLVTNFEHKLCFEEDIQQTMIRHILQIQECGLSLPDQILSNIFGNDFVQKRNTMFRNYKKRQQSLISRKQTVTRCVQTSVRDGTDIMFITPIPHTNNFTQCSNNKIRVIDKEFTELKCIDTDFDIREWMVIPNFCGGEPCTYYGQLYHTFRVRTKTYLQFFQYVYELEDKSLKQVCEIPNLEINNYAKFYGKLFTLNDELYMQNYREIFKLVDGASKFVKDLGQFFQFCDTVVNVNFNCGNNSDDNKIRFIEIKQDLSEGQVWETQGGYTLCFAQGGVAGVIQYCSRIIWRGIRGKEKLNVQIVGQQARKE